MRECDGQGAPTTPPSTTCCTAGTKRTTARCAAATRDLVEAIVDGARYDNRDPKLDILTLDEVRTTYFLKPMNAPS